MASSHSTSCPRPVSTCSSSKPRERRPRLLRRPYSGRTDTLGCAFFRHRRRLSPRVKITAFYYGDTMPDVAFYRHPGKEQTHTFGLRLLASQDGFDGSIGGIGQVGTLASQNVLAWGCACRRRLDVQSAMDAAVGHSHRHPERRRRRNRPTRSTHSIRTTPTPQKQRSRRQPT